MSKKHYWGGILMEHTVVIRIVLSDKKRKHLYSRYSTHVAVIKKALDGSTVCAFRQNCGANPSPHREYNGFYCPTTLFYNSELHQNAAPV